MPRQHNVAIVSGRPTLHDVVVTVAERIKQALDLAGMELPARPHVVDLVYEIAPDSTGDPSIFIWVIVDDRASEKDFSRKVLEKVEDAIRSALAKHEVELWPYIRYRTASEQDEIARAARS